MINLRDIADLWELEIPDDKWMLARDGVRFGGKEFCVILFDNAKFKHNLAHPIVWKHVDYAHQQYMEFFIDQKVVGDLDPRWNCHDGDDLDIDDIWQLHYTNMATQPWRPAWYTGQIAEHRRPEIFNLWFDMKQEAIDSGYSVDDYSPEEDFGPYNIIGK